MGRAEIDHFLKPAMQHAAACLEIFSSLNHYILLLNLITFKELKCYHALESRSLYPNVFIHDIIGNSLVPFSKDGWNLINAYYDYVNESENWG